MISNLWTRLAPSFLATESLPKHLRRIRSGATAVAAISVCSFSYGQTAVVSGGCFFGNANFDGKVMCPGEGAANLDNSWKNTVSSVMVRPGFTLDLFTGRNQTGQKLSLVANADTLVPLNFNDKMLSYKVTRGTVIPAKNICFYELPNYQGKSFCADTGAEPDLPFGRDKLYSSVKVTPGYSVDLFENTFYAGRTVSVLGNTPNLAAVNFDNLTSSYRVIPGVVPTPPPEPAPRPCGGQTLGWSVNNASCSAPFASANSGNSSTAVNTLSANSGGATFVCTNGNWGSAQQAVCIAPPVPPPPPVAVVRPVLSESDPVGKSQTRLNAITLTADAPGYAATAPMAGTTAAVEMAADKQARITAAFDLAANAVDPDPRWFSTSLLPAAKLMASGESITVEVSKVDVNGLVYTGVNASELGIKVAWQRADGTIVTGLGSAAWISPGILRVTAPIAQGVGRLLVSLQPVSTDPGVRAKTARWSAVFSGEDWSLKSGVVSLGTAGKVMLPLPGGSVAASQFNLSDMRVALQSFKASAVGADSVGYPVVIANSARIAAGTAVHLVEQGQPIGGVVFSSVTRGTEQMLVVKLDPGAVYHSAVYSQDRLVAAGLFPELPVWSISGTTANSILTPTRLAPPASGQGAQRLVRADWFNTPADCKLAGDSGVDLQFIPVWNFDTMDFGLHVRPNLSTKAELACTWKADFGNVAALKAAVAGGPVTLLVGADIAPSPYGEIKMALSSEASWPAQLTVVTGWSSAQGGKFELPPVKNLGTGLIGLAVTVKGGVSGELGLKSAIKGNIRGGAVGVVLGLSNLVTGGQEADADTEVKAFVNLGLDATFPNAAKVYASNVGTGVKVAAKAGAKAKLPKAVVAFLASGRAQNDPSGSLKAEVTIAEAGLNMAFDATAEPATQTSAKVTKLAPMASLSGAIRTLIPTVAAAGSTPVQIHTALQGTANGQLAPAEGQSRSFFGASVKAGGVASASGAECQAGSVDSPILGSVNLLLLGMSKPVHICDPQQKKPPPPTSSSQSEGVFDIPAGMGYRVTGITHSDTGHAQVRRRSGFHSYNASPYPSQIILKKRVENGICYHSGATVVSPGYTQWMGAIWLFSELRLGERYFETTKFQCDSFEIEFFDANQGWCELNPTFTWDKRCGGSGVRPPPPPIDCPRCR